MSLEINNRLLLKARVPVRPWEFRFIVKIKKYAQFMDLYFVRCNKSLKIKIISRNSRFDCPYLLLNVVSLTPRV